MASRYYLLFIVLSFFISLTISVSFVENRAERSVYDLVEGHSARESELATSQIDQFIDSRIQVVKDISDQPIIISGVMGTMQSQALLKDYMQDLSVLGNKESFVLFDIFGEEVFSSLIGSSQLELPKAPWFEALIANNRESAIFLVDQNNKPSFAIATPTKYNGLAEGILVVVFNKPIEYFIGPLISESSHGAVSITGPYLNYQSIGSFDTYRLIQERIVDENDLIIRYFIDQLAVDEVKWLFMKDIALSVFFGLTISFVFLSFIGRKLILKPFKKLEDSQQETQEALRNLENLKYAVDQHSIVAITNINGTITFANEKFSEISGYENAELVGQNHRILNSGTHDKTFFTQLYKTISKGRVWKGDICNRAKNGSLYWVDTTIIPLLDSNKKIESYIEIRSDITENVNANNMLLEARDEAQQAATAKSEFLANMSHEIRTPMNGIIGMLALLKNTELTTEQRQKVEVAGNSANSLLVLLNDILDISKIEAGKLELESISFDLRKLLGECIETLSYMVPDAQDIELILDISDITDSMVMGDPGRVRQVVTNLLSNAIKFTQEGEILLSASLSESEDNQLQLQCSVRDTGIGIPADKLALLFDQFSQVDSSTTRKFGGTGLGLSITKKLCSMMNGSVSVTSDLGKGSCFSFEITLLKTEPYSVSIPDIDISGCSFLIVDAHETSRAVLRKQLEQWGGQVTEAGSGAEAINLGRSNRDHEEPKAFDVVFIDQHLPGMGGQELGVLLLNDNHIQPMKLILMTSIGFRGDAREYANIGFSAYLQKPATPFLLLDALRVIIDEGKPFTDAEPLVTGHYINSLGNKQTPSKLFDKGTRLLLVEDNKVNQLVAKAFLEQYGLDISVAENGLEALNILEKQADDSPFSLVLMDCQMPKMDGYEATRQIREGAAGERSRNLPIVAMTANVMKGDKDKCLDAGMDDYVPKPIEDKILRNTLLKWLQSSARSSA